jgi:outer membrane lipoprotein-sorting protein
MKPRVLCLAVALFFVALAANSQQADNAGQLESVLNSMDKAAANFKTVEATFAWDQFSKVVNETDTQNGTMYFRRSGNNIEMAAHIEKPDAKIVVFSDAIVRIYQPKIDLEQRYNAGKNREVFESFLVLGFGGRGHDLNKSFDVQYGGSEAVDGINTAKLLLTPKDPKVKNMFNSIVLWIDPARGISIQQKFFQPDGDYRLAKYSNIKTQQKLPDNAFKIPSTHKTKIETPNG